MKEIGYALLLVGFLFGAFVSVSQVDSVNWLLYGLAAAAMLGGLVAVRLKSDETVHDTKREDDVRVLRESLASLVVKLESMIAKKEETDVYHVHGNIDDTLMEDLDRFVQRRESLIPAYGLQPYADVMSPFAGSERLINRAWSASADGYIDEVWASLDGAREEMSRARDALSKLGS